MGKHVNVPQHRLTINLMLLDGPSAQETESNIKLFSNMRETRKIQSVVFTIDA